MIDSEKTDEGNQEADFAEKKKKNEFSGFERSTLRWTIVIVAVNALTCLFIALQWYEIKSGSADTHTLAEQAKKQATAAEMSANAAYAELRPWMRIMDVQLRGGKDPIETLMFHWPLTGKPVAPMLQVKVSAFNVGHSVAQNAEVFPELFFGTFEADKWHDVVTQEERRFCQSVMNRREQARDMAVIFPSDSKDWYIGVGGTMQEPNHKAASALIVCVNYTSVATNNLQTQAWFGLYERRSVLIDLGTDVNATELQLIRDESGDHAY
jgi:cell division protein FtsL